jgi:effector-binding domain-containing protein
MIKSAANTAGRGLLQDENWPKWLSPLYISGNADKLATWEDGYEVTNKFNRELEIQILKGKEKIGSRMYVVPQPLDSVMVKWHCQLVAGINPISRVRQYRNAVVIKERMSRTLNQLKSFLSKTENVYAIPIERTIVSDTILIATRAYFKDQPSTDEIYGLINQLRKYISQQGAKETGYPMMHTQQQDSAGVQIMVAIPVNKRLPDAGKFFFRKMVKGYILVAVVEGGNASIQRAFTEMENYMVDNQKQKIAIDFESLVTDRQAEKDTTKWITKIYFPIVQ